MILEGIDTIIFDLGGVMIDLDRERCIESFTAIGFAEADKFIDFYHPADIFHKLESGEIDAAQVCDLIREQSGLAMTDEQITAAYSSFLEGVPVAKLQLLRDLRARGYKLYALSNNNPLVYGRVCELFTQQGLTIEDYFDKIYLSFEMKAVKPDRRIFDMMIADSGVVPEHALFVEDGIRNVEAARELGFAVYMPAAREDFSHIFSEV